MAISGDHASVPSTEVEWVNHASFIVRYGQSSILCDPWLNGPVFNAGWELLVPSVHDESVVADATALWISHVHPDHFSTRLLRSVPGTVRRKTPVYFQKTLDQQVARFCRGIGYPVTEMRDGETVQVAPDMRLTVGRVPFYDSWALIQTPDAKILNLNDCVLKRPRDLRRLAERVGPIDVLMTQFSYASWIGGPADVAMRRDAAAEKLCRVKDQIEALKPRFCIPFASFVVFAHEENFYLNDERNTVTAAVEVITNARVDPIVLFPGEKWTVNMPRDSGQAIERYESAWDISFRTPHSSRPMELSELDHLATRWAKRLAKRNNRLLMKGGALLGVGGPLVVQLTDLGVTVRVSPVRGLEPVSGLLPDISMSSQSLAYTLRFDWGSDTLSVNGRFRATQAGYRKMLQTFVPSLLNNHGRALSFRLLADRWLVRRAIDRFVRKAE